MDNKITIAFPILATDVSEGAQRLASLVSIPKELEIDPQRIVDELNKILQMVNSLQAPSSSSFQLSELEFNLVVNGKGKLALLGIGLESGIQAAIKLKITRQSS